MSAILRSARRSAGHPPRARRPLALLSWLVALIIPAIAFALQPASIGATADGAAAAPTFTSPCFTPAAIYNGLPPQQTGTYTVPATGVTTVRAVLRGQNGGRGGYSGGPYIYDGGTDGGLGATMVVEVAVTPGQVLQVGRLTGAPGGSATQAEFSGGKGGDAQYLSTAGSDGCQHALAVAGGGGGGSGKGARGGNADAGAGATGGQDGGNNNQEDGAGGGGAQATIGGTPGAHGYGGIFSECNDGNNGRWGEFLTGGDGANAPSSKQTSGGTAFPVDSGCARVSFPGGGGGGGGYRYGGGGGSPFGYAADIWSTSNAGGGGGGSSYLDPSATKVSLSAGAAAGDPLVVPVYFTGMTLTSSLNPSIGGNAVTFTATVVTIGSYQPVAGGTVDIYLGATPTTISVGTNGVASLTTTTLPVGTTTVRARFNDTTTATAAYRASYNPTDIYQVVKPCAAAPSFSIQPGKLTAAYGTSVIFNVALTYPPAGAANPTVQWQTSTNGGTTWTDLAGEVSYSNLITNTGSVLLVEIAFNASVTPGDVQYRAIATSCGGSTTSNAATLTVIGLALDFTGISKAYGDTFDIGPYAAASNKAASFSSNTPTTCTVAGTTVTLVGAGTCTITAEQAKPLTDPLVPSVQRSFTVNKKVLTVVAGSPPSQPQGTASSPTVTCTAALVGSDGFLTAPIGAVYTNIILSDGTNMLRKISVGASTTQGNYVTQCTGGDAGGNYTIGGYTKGTFRITAPLPPTLTISASNKSYTYGTTPPALDATYSSGSITRSGTLSCNAYAKSDTTYASPLALSTTTPVVTGGYTIRCSGITSANPVAWANGTLTVNPASVSVTAGSPAAQSYGTAAAPTVTCAATGFVGADGFGTAPTGTVYDAAGTNQATIGATADAGSYVTKCAGGDPGGNYTIGGYTGGTFTITPAALTVTPDADQSMPYGSTALPTLSFQLAGFKNGQQGDVVTGQPSCAPAATAYNGTTAGSGSPVGDYAITCAGGQAANYTFSDNSGARRFAVTPAALTITPESKSMTSGGTRPTMTWQASGLENGDTAESAFAAPNTAPSCAAPTATNRLGAYPITCAGAANPNYTIAYTPGTLNVGADGAAQLAIVAGSPQSAAVTTPYGTPFKVVVRDQYGNPVADGTTVTFTAPASGASGTFAGGGTTATATTTNGIATAPIFTANGVAGAFTVQAAAGGGVLPLSLTNTPGPVARFAVAANPTATAVGAAVGLTVTAQDNQGNTVQGYTGTVHFTSSDPQATLPADYTFLAGDNGAHPFTATFATAGSQTIAATDTANAGVTGSATLTIGAAAPSTLTATGGTPQSRAIGQAFAPLTARVVDSYGNPVAGVAVTFAAPASGASATFPGGAASATVATGADGVATAPTATANGTVGGYTIVASGAGGSASFALTNTPGPATQLVASGLVGSAQAGTPVTFTVTALDAGGNVATGYTGTLHVTGSDPQATLPADYTFTGTDAGTHQFAATLRTGGAQTITATDTASGALTASATTQVVVPAAPAGASVTPSSLPFGTRQVGTVGDSQQVTVTNTGGSNLNIGGVTFGGANADQFNLAYNNCVGAIVPTAACTIGVRFAPTAVQPSTATLLIADDAAGSPQTVALSGTGAAAPQPSPAAASVSPPSLTYATTLVGQQTNAQQITVTNTGGTALNIAGVTLGGAHPGDFVVTYTNCAGAVAPNMACTIGVAFAPTAADARTATVSIADDAAGSPQTVALGGTGAVTPPPAAPQASLAPTTVPFAATQVGQQTNAQLVTVTNTGGSALNITGVTLGGAHPGDFGIAYTNCAGAIAPNAACTIGVRFGPTAPGARSATLQIADDATGSPQTVALAGTGSAVPQPSPAAASAAPASLTFDARQVGTASDSQQVTLRNGGGSPLAISGVTLGGANPGDFAITFNSCVDSIPAGASCVVGVRFAPTAAGARAATLQFADGAAGSPQTVALAGTATAPPATPIPQSVVTASAQGNGSVTPTGATSYATGGTATYAATAASGQVFVGWTLDGRYAGYASPLTFTVGADRTLVATFAARPTFSDVPTSDPDYREITTLAALGIINPNGVNGSGQFQPDRAVNRAEVAAFVARLFGWEREFHGNPFPDKCDPRGANCVDDQLWNDVAALKDYGVIGGYNDAATCQASGTTAPCFLPRESVLKLQVVSIVARAFTKTPDLRPTGFWDRLAANPAQYTNVPDAGSQRSDLTTYRANAGPIPGQANDAAFPQPTDPATRRFIIQVLWQAYSAQFGVDRVP